MTSESGFSLLEALVATFVLAMAALGIAQLTAQTLRFSAETAERVLAGQVAENIAVDTLTDPSTWQTGKTSGETIQRRRSFVWERTITAAGSERLIEIDIRVRAGDTGPVRAQLSTLHFIGKTE